MLRTIELILGMQPLSLNDGLATPMYDAFGTRPDPTPYDAIRPEQPLDERNPVPATSGTSGTSGTATAEPVGLLAMMSSPTVAVASALALELPFDQLDLVPQELSDAVLWQSVHGWDSTPPPPGPGASPAEHARALTAIDAFHADADIGEQLELVSTPDDDDG